MSKKHSVSYQQSAELSVGYSVFSAELFPSPTSIKWHLDMQIRVIWTS